MLKEVLEDACSATNTLIKHRLQKDEFPTVRDYRTGYRLRALAVYLERVLEKNDEENQLCKLYWRGLKGNLDLVPKSNRDSKRLATTEQRKQLENKCVACDRNNPGYHHIIEHCYGGPTTPWNLVPLCCACHDLIPNVEASLFASEELQEIEEQVEAGKVVSD